VTAPLAALLPKPGEPKLTPDQALDRFVSYVTGKALTLYPAQEEAILELLGGKHVVLATPTGSGKSLVAEAFHFMAMAEGKTSFYTCPIKALVNEKFFALCDAFGAENVGMMTGDAAINRKAPIICCTAEILSNLCLREQRLFAECVVMDEFHYYGDRERGVAWQVPLLSMPETQFLLMSATLGDLTSIKESLGEVTHREVAEVRSAQRPVPLEFRYEEEDPLHDTIRGLLRENKAPVYLVNFTQRTAAEQAQNLMSIDVCSKEEKEKLKVALQGARFDTPFGKDLRRLLLHGVGLHHAGLLPKYRRLVERLSQQGLLKVISGTDTLGVGVNIPIRTVLFTQLCKYDGEKTAVLSVRDFQQISGRAGRKGFDERGFVVAQAPAHTIENRKLQQKKAEGKKVVLQKPPEKGYAHWDRQTFERLTSSLPEKLESRFTVTHGLIVNLLQAHQDSSTSGYRKLVELVMKCHGTPVFRTRLLKHARTLFRSLVTAGLIEVAKRTATAPAQVRVHEDLQRDFSLNHTLSLYLVDTLPQLVPPLPGLGERAGVRGPVAESQAPAAPAHTDVYALDVLSLIEAILESPDAVLYAQLDKLKGDKVRELKAQGVEYAQRMEELEKLTWPKPNAEFIYGTFDAFAVKHPWVAHENIRPKSVARELFELCMTFNEYVKEYGLQRSEGVLLRYLSDVYKTLVQNVPEALKTEQLEDVAAYLLTTLKHTDSSLVEEWEALRYGRQLGLVAPPGEEQPRPKKDLAKDLKGLTARARAEMHQVVKLLAKKQYEELAEQLGPDAGWTADTLEAAMAPYWAEHPTLDTTPRARQPVLTQLTADGERAWRVRHNLLDSKGEQDWFLEGVIDLREREDVEGALVTVRHLGR